MTAVDRPRALSWLGQCALTICLLTAFPIFADFEVSDINEGELQFLTKLPDKPPHHHTLTVTISPDSLRDGWVNANQCHYQLDQVGALQVVFRPGRVRKLRILRSDNIGRVWVEHDSVQLENIGADAVLCFVSENRVLHYDAAKGRYRWRGGPYMRRFLDGFFPMRVSLVLNYPETLLKLADIEPKVLKFRAVDSPGQLRLDALFEGKLFIALEFDGPKIGDGIGWE